MLRLLGWALIQYDGRLNKWEISGHGDTHGEDGHPQAREQGLGHTLPSWPSEGSNPAGTKLLAFRSVTVNFWCFLCFVTAALVQ